MASSRIKTAEGAVANLRDVHAQTQRTRYAFLTTDLEVCATFGKIVETKLALGKPDAARRVLESAEAGYATIRRLSPRLENADERKEIEEKLNQLRVRLDALDCKLHSRAKP
jgi:hypothetical protein